MNIDGIFQDPEYGNFVCVYLGLAFVGQILEPYTRNGLQQVHQKIQTALAGNPQCPGTCGNNSSRWCETCKKWQKKLRAFSRQQEFDWTKQESWKWMLSYEHIAGIFTSLPGGPVNFRDISTACSIWTSCKEFNIQPFALQNVKDCRNKYFAHNDTLKVTDVEKARAFDALTDLLKQGDIQNHINKQDCLNKLEEIKNGKSLPMEIARIGQEIKKICYDEDKIVKIVTELTDSATEDREELHRIQNLVLKLHERQRREHVFLRARLDVVLNILRNMRSYLKYLCVTVGILVAIVLVSFSLSHLQRDHTRELNSIPSISYRSSMDSKYSGCLSEFYEDHPSSQPLDFHHLGDLPTQNKLIGREWIFNLFEEKMFQLQNKSRGMLMIAEYGFGKSAIVAHLLCAQENEKGWKLRQHVVAFHVCKFRNEISKKPVQLIKRLRWFLSVKSDEYRQHIASLKNSIIDDDGKCEMNIDKCFDDAISNPLDKLTIPHDAPWIVVIDALDECNETDGRNRILEQLSDHLIFMQQKRRKWFKWIITTRNMSSLLKLRKLDTVKFSFEDKRNYRDIRQYVMKKLNVSDGWLLDMFVDKSGGNFLYIEYALEYIVESGNVSIQNIVNLPSGIEEIYELNFDRLFGNNNDFEVAKHILQLISIKMFHTADLLRIIEANQSTNESEFGRIMDKLSFFVSSGDYVAFRHKSLLKWLRSDTNLKYRISLRLGHVTVSEYLFSRTDVNDLQFAENYYGQFYTSKTFIELAYHISESGETFLQRKFFSLSPGKTRYINSNFYLISGDNIRSNKMLKLIVNFVRDKTAQYKKLFIRIIRYFYHSILKYKYLGWDSVSFMLDNVGNVYEIDKHPLHTAAEHCNEDLARYLINVVNISLWERGHDAFSRAIDYARDFGCSSVAKLIAEKDPSVLDAQFVMSATLFDAKISIDIIKLLVAKRKILNCVDFILQKEIMMHVYSIRNMNYPLSVNSFSFMIDSRNAFIKRIFGIFVTVKNRRRIFNTIADLYPELLSCPDIFGYTPALKFILLNSYKEFSTVLDLGINDKCQPVPIGSLYIYYVFTLYSSISHVLYFLATYPSFMYTDVACPEEASAEHLLMRHKRIDMINLVNGYIMNWTKSDRKGKTPLDYADQMFILQLECHFGVDIDVLSDKNSLVRLCLCEWFYFYLLLVISALAYYIACLYCIVLYFLESILCVFLKVALVL